MAGSARTTSATSPTSTAFFNIRRSPSSVSLVFFVCREQVDVDARQGDEDEGLEERREEPQDHEGPGHDDRGDRGEEPRDRVLARDVHVETQRQRENAREVADRLDDEKEGGQPPDRTQEVLEIA